MTEQQWSDMLSLFEQRYGAAHAVLLWSCAVFANLIEPTMSFAPELRLNVLRTTSHAFPLNSPSDPLLPLLVFCAVAFDNRREESHFPTARPSAV